MLLDAHSSKTRWILLRTFCTTLASPDYLRHWNYLEYCYDASLANVKNFLEVRRQSGCRGGFDIGVEHREDFPNRTVFNEFERAVVDGDLLDHEVPQTSGAVCRAMRELVNFARRVCFLATAVDMTAKVCRRGVGFGAQEDSVATTIN